MPPIDLGRISGGASLLDTEIFPREIFNLLPAKHERYKYLRDVQGEVLGRWFERRKDQDLVIKMNTGGGKTVVGLLLLKSCLNEGIHPAYYVAPDIYLATQVMREAADLGLFVSDDPTAPAVLQGKAIGVINIRTIINGKSRFGVGGEGQKIKIGSVLIDDAHACLTTTESQFTLTIGNAEQLYDDLFALFRDDLAAQSDSGVSELEANAPGVYMLVPFWAWVAKVDLVARALATHRKDESVQWAWPLIKEYLSLCRCVFSGRTVEISPRSLPVEVIPSFVMAKRRIFMTATLADDSILVSDFNCDPELVTKHITPSSANDIGDRMILVPQEIDPTITDEEIRDFLVGKSRQFNVVVIVPSRARAAFWEEFAARVVTAENIEATVDVLKKKHVGLVVLLNKYDGVDLPNDACRILVLDGLPRAYRQMEHIDTQMLHGSAQIMGRQMQRIEQGMGRGIRSNDDYCVVLLMGASLIKDLFVGEAMSYFSRATQAQISLSRKVAEQIGSGFNEIEEAMQYCLNQTPAWRKLAREALANITYPAMGIVRPIAVAQRKAFDAAVVRDFKRAAAAIQDLLNENGPTKIMDKVVRGWLMWQLAEYIQHRDAVEAQQLLKSAAGFNRNVTKPLQGIEYEKLDATKVEQALNAIWALKPYVASANKLLIAANGILDDLQFVPDTADRFEQALKEISLFLGFRAQRPEREFGKGPDVLWAVGNLRYFVIECKNGATVGKVSKADTNQLAGSVNWFNARYDQTCACTPILIHPSATFEHAASPHEDARVMTDSGLSAFKDAVRQYVTAAAAQLENLSRASVAALLQQHKLTPDLILQSFTVKPKA